MHNVFRDTGDHFLGRYVDSLWSLEGLNAKTSSFIKKQNQNNSEIPFQNQIIPNTCALGALCR